MVVVGLGTNVGERLTHLRRALTLLSNHPKITVCHVSPVYESKAQLPPCAPSSWSLPYFNVAVSCKTDLSPYRLLDELQQIEQLMGRKKYGTWSPRNIDIDILLWGDIKIESERLNIPHKLLFERPFSLWPLLDVYADWDYPHELVAQWGSRFDGQAPFGTFQLPYRIDGSRMVGIIDVATADNSELLARAKQLFNSGAEVLTITSVKQWSQVEALLDRLTVFWKGKEYGPKLNLDITSAELALRAIEAGVDWINDLNGFTSPEMLAALRDTSVKLVCTHRLSITGDPVASLMTWSQSEKKRLVENGIAESRLILDPGLAFNKTVEQRAILVKRIAELKQTGLSLYVGFSPTESQFDEIEEILLAIHLFSKEVDYLCVRNLISGIRAIAIQKSFDSISVQHDNNLELMDTLS